MYTSCSLFDFLLEQVPFVEEEDDGSVREPLVVADGVKQSHAFVDSVDRLVFVQYLLVALMALSVSKLQPILIYTQTLARPSEKRKTAIPTFEVEIIQRDHYASCNLDN